MASLSKKQSALLGAALGAAYGLVARLIFGFGLARSDVFEVMSTAFIFGVPFALGFVTIWFGDPQNKVRWLRCIFLPWIAGLLCLLCALALVWEGIICILLWLPLVLILSSFGGLVAGICHRLFKAKRDRTYCVVAVALLPFLAAPLEQFHSAASEIRTVNTQIRIHANPQTVWEQIRTVPLIGEREQSFSFSHLLGFPRQLEAKLVGEGVGAVRYATFERGVLFVETITEWNEPQRLSFSIHADAEHIPPSTFDEHVTIGGKYFDVLTGTYWIETAGEGDVILHLASDQRLSTRFNFYSHFWTEYLMADLQNYILKIIKRRCEANTFPAHGNSQVDARFSSGKHPDRSPPTSRPSTFIKKIPSLR